jgi:hypothetical protein
LKSINTRAYIYILCFVYILKKNENPLFQHNRSAHIEINQHTCIYIYIYLFCALCVYIKRMIDSYATSDGSATAGSDYTATGDTVLIPPGTQAVSVSVPIADDATSEPPETFTVALVATVNAPISGSGSGSGGGSAAVTITDNDSSAISVDAGTVVGEGAGLVEVTVRLAGPSACVAAWKKIGRLVKLAARRLSVCSNCLFAPNCLFGLLQLSVCSNCLFGQMVCLLQLSVCSNCLFAPIVYSLQLSVCSNCLFAPIVCLLQLIVLAVERLYERFCSSQVFTIVRLTWLVTHLIPP